jgi:hypothetical protein
MAMYTCLVGTGEREQMAAVLGDALLVEGIVDSLRQAAGHLGNWKLQVFNEDDARSSIGRFENMDTIVAFYQNPNDVATITVVDPDENLGDDLELRVLSVRGVLVAYYLAPNDFDDFNLSTAYIEERQHCITSITDAYRADKRLFWLGRDPLYVRVVDANANVDVCCPEQVVVMPFAAPLPESANASDAQMYFSSDKNGQNRVMKAQEDDRPFIAVIDNDQNIDCDVRGEIALHQQVAPQWSGALPVASTAW